MSVDIEPDYTRVVKFNPKFTPPKLTKHLNSIISNKNRKRNKKKVNFAPGTKLEDAILPNKYHIIDTRYRNYVNESFRNANIILAKGKLNAENRRKFELYDPARPNDYDDYLKEKEENLLFNENEDKFMVNDRSKESLDSSKIFRINSGEFRNNLKEENKDDVPFMNTFAEKMMKKMGWEEGKGLGKSQQGISSCLIPTGSFNKLNEADRRLSTVMCILNMVGKNELDPAIRNETIHECSKYGEVVECIVYVNPLPNCPADEEVTLFVKFHYDVDCEKAILSMNGRYFGGRIVKCYFFDEERYLRGEFL